MGPSSEILNCSPPSPPPTSNQVVSPLERVRSCWLGDSPVGELRPEGASRPAGIAWETQAQRSLMVVWEFMIPTVRGGRRHSG
jgi:hypothetical protein